MRKRKEILGVLGAARGVPVSNSLILEVLLDIRELLEDDRNH